MRDAGSKVRGHGTERAAAVAALVVVFVVAVLVTAAAPVKAQLGVGERQLAWRVVNPFRFFNDAQDTKRHLHAYRWLTGEERRTPVLSIERKLAAKQPGGWAGDVFETTCWDRESNRHRCPDGSEYINPQHHRVEVRLEGSALEIAADAMCAWHIETAVTRPRAGKAPQKVRRFEARCWEAQTFEVPYPAGSVVRVGRGGEEIAKVTIRVRDIFVVGMGDSFGSGEGNPDKPVRFSAKRTASYGSVGEDNAFAGYPVRIGNWREIGDSRFLKAGARWLDRACHRSLYSYQLRAALQLAIEEPHRAVTFVGVACSGAEVTRGLFLRYKGNEWVANPPDLSQISAVAQAQCGERRAPEKEYPEAYHLRGRIVDLQGSHVVLRKCPARHAREIDLLFLSIGGNDIGFSRLVANAVLRDKTVLKRLGGWFGHVFEPDDVEAPIKEVEARYKALDRALHYILHLPWQKNGRVILSAYPGMALLEDGKRVCPDSRLGMDVLPQFRLSARRALDGERIGERLYRTMRKAARARGWRLADTHRARFLGRGICAGGAGFTAAEELRLPRKRNGYWQPYSPENFEPYTTRQRWFRTPNDAFMTANFHVRGSLARQLLRTRRLQWTQLLLASTYSGAFHPTAEGQAAIADAVVREARQVLAERQVPTHRTGVYRNQ